MKFRLVIASILVAATIFAIGFFNRDRAVQADQRTNSDSFLNSLQPVTGAAAAFAVTKPLSELDVVRPQFDAGTAQFKSDAGSFIIPPSTVRPSDDHTPATLLGTQMPPPLNSFDGISNRSNGEIFQLLFLPSDSSGDVGPNHYVQVVNTLFRVYDKSGTALTPPLKMSDLFAPLGTLCATRDDGQPVVAYDPLADRWLLSQYCQAFPPFRQMIAVSRTGDPTGAYSIYEFVMPNNRLNDYAKFGVWPGAYFMSTDEFIGSDYAGAGMFAFDREKLLRGDSSAGYVYFNIPSVSPVRLRGILPADLDGLASPPDGTTGIFMSYNADEYGDPADALRLFDFNADFVNPLQSSFTERAESPLGVAPFNPTSPDGRADIAQPAPGDFLDSQSDRLMQRVAYRRFPTHESIVVNQTVRTTGSGSVYRAGVRLHELRRTGTAFSVHDSTTLGDFDSSRWMGAAAQDHNGNIAFGFSTGSNEKKPGIAYAGRLATEPVGSFRPERALIEGTGVQTAFGFRWGNVSGMTVDPVDDCSFWLTNQYFSAASQAESAFSWLTRIGSFHFAECSPAPRAGLRVIVRESGNSLPLAQSEVSLLDSTTNSSAGFWRQTTADGSTGRMIVLPGNYVVRAARQGYRAVSQNVSLPNDPNGTVTVEIALEPVAVPFSAPLTLTNESCRLNQAVEPGELITFDLTLRNGGARPTNNLTASLLTSAAVTNPSGAANFGALPADATTTATRSFSFRASSSLTCGNPVELRFALSDGAENLGQLVVTLNGGSPRIAFSEDFDASVAPALPSGWTTSATGAGQNWTTSAVRRESLPNSVFSPSPNQIGINELVTPPFPVTTNAATLQFRNWYEHETTFLRNRLYDGSVLEIEQGDGVWRDIELAGGTFLRGGYDGVIDACCQNPLAGRRGWSGRSGINQTSEFITSTVRLPATAAGRNVRLRWRVGNDLGTFRTGQFLDNIVVTDGSLCGCTQSPNGRAPFDFDGDGRTDLAVFAPSNDAGVADFRGRRSSDGSSFEFAFGSIGDRAVPADFDGDGRADIAVFRPESGNWFILRSSDAGVVITNFGLAGDRLVPADYDGDGRADVAVFRPSDGLWYIRRSSDDGVVIRRFGLTGDLPVPADFDGDQRVDIAVFRPSDGIWYVLRSSDDGFSATRFGLAGDRPVAGDFDGDGRFDIAVFRPSDRTWYLLRTTSGFTAVQFGLADDVPLQADFDGDGKREIAVFRPSERVWYFLRSLDGEFRAETFGQPGDQPLPSVFVP